MITKDDGQHLRRRTWLVIWLQILQELVGIGVVTVYAPEVFQLVSLSSNQEQDYFYFYYDYGSYQIKKRLFYYYHSYD